MFDEPPLINGNKTLPKCPKQTLRIDLNQIMQQKDVPKGTCALGMPNIPPLEENQKITPLLLTLPTIMTSSVMEPPMSIPCETSIAKIPIDTQRKSLIDISPIPQRNVAHFHIDMMFQGETPNTQKYQNKDLNMMLTYKGHNQLPRQQQSQVHQEPNIANAQLSQN